MRFEELLKAFRGQPVFDISSVSLVFAHESATTVRSSLYRFARDGKIVALRRGLYVFAEPWRSTAPHAPYLARHIYAPSYLSERWALSYYSVIPEKASRLTCVGTRVTRHFSNPFGEFQYRTVAVSLFYGYEECTLSAWPVLIARPEKALLDLWYLESGEWSAERMASFRFDPEPIDMAALKALSAGFDSPRIGRALAVWERYREEECLGERPI